MSNRSNASRYDGSPSIRSNSSGGSDLFGLQAKRQKDMLAYQQALELERMKQAHEYDVQDTDLAARNEKDKALNDAAIKIAMQAGIIPTDSNIKSLDQATTEQQLGIIKIKQALEQQTAQNQLSVASNPDTLKALQQNQLDVLAKPGVDNNLANAQAMKFATTEIPPNTITRIPLTSNVNGPYGMGQGMTQKITTVGGITDPSTGMTIGGRPVETYTGGKIPVGKLNINDNQSLSNNVQTKPDSFNVVGNSGAPMQNSFESLGLNFATQPQSQGSQQVPTDVATKPPLFQMNPGPQVDWRQVMNFLKMQTQGPRMLGH